jgi:hypothetical protein
MVDHIQLFWEDIQTKFWQLAGAYIVICWSPGGSASGLRLWCTISLQVYLRKPGFPRPTIVIPHPQMPSALQWVPLEYLMMSFSWKGHLCMRWIYSKDAFYKPGSLHSGSTSSASNLSSFLYSLACLQTKSWFLEIKVYWWKTAKWTLKVVGSSIRHIRRCGQYKDCCQYWANQWEKNRYLDSGNAAHVSPSLSTAPVRYS